MNRATVPAFHWWLFLYFLQFSSTFLMAFGGQFPRQKERQKNLSKPRKILEDGNQRNGELFVGMLPKLGGNDNGLLMGWSGWSEWSHCSAKVFSKIWKQDISGSFRICAFLLAIAHSSTRKKPI
jgi:hypothetical protein